MDLPTQFRNAAEEKGLTKAYDGQPEFIFYLNQGDIRTDKDPKTVLEVIALADEVYKKGGMNGSGEGRIMLGLYTKKSDIDQKSVVWDNGSALIGEYDNLNDYVTLDCYLANCEELTE